MRPTDNSDSDKVRSDSGAAEVQAAISPLSSLASYSHHSSRDLFHPPRLGIIHLLAWTGLSAVLMKVSQGIGWLDFASEDFPVWINGLFIASNVIHSVTLAGGIVGTCIIIRSRYLGIGGRLQAGHWMVFNLTVVSILRLALIIPLEMLRNGLLGSALEQAFHTEKFVFALFSILGIMQLLLSSLWIVAAIRTIEPVRWKSVFGFLTLINLGAGLMYFAEAFFPSFHMFMRYPIGSSLTLLILPVVTIIDWATHVKRDWLHYLGLTTILVVSLLTVLQSVAVFFLNH